MDQNNFVDVSISSLKTKPNSLGGFLAGTLVYTDKGLVPIEQVKVGDKVLSKSETGLGENFYKPVTRTLEFEDKEVWFVEVTNIFFNDAIEDSSSKPPYVTERFIGAPNHSFLVVGYVDHVSDADLGYQEIFFLRKKYWSRLDALKLGAVLLLANGSYVAVGSVQSIFEMRDENCGFVQGYRSPSWDEEAYGRFLLFNKRGFLPHLKRANRMLNDYGANPPIKRAKVYGINVGDFHTYFVGRCGLWVNNTGRSNEKACLE